MIHRLSRSPKSQHHRLSRPICPPFGRAELSRSFHCVLEKVEHPISHQRASSQRHFTLIIGTLLICCGFLTPRSKGGLTRPFRALPYGKKTSLILSFVIEVFNLNVNDSLACPFFIHIVFLSTDSACFKTIEVTWYRRLLGSHLFIEPATSDVEVKT